MTRYSTNLNKEQSSTDNLSNNQIKTTDVNVLLNRVRLDKKKYFKKKILFSLLMVSLVSSISIFFII